jgi:DivIVA domain-containing protein
MIDLTPLDVRSKRGDFRRLMRGYDPQEVDTFLELVAERLEQLTRESIALRERTQILQQQVDSQSDREHAVQEALVTAQELRADIRGQAQREAEGVLKEAETEGRRLVAEAEAEARTMRRGSERRMEQLEDSLQEIERRRARFLKEFRQLLERELDVVQVEEGRQPLEERTIDLDLGGAKAPEVFVPVPPSAGEEPSVAPPRTGEEPSVEVDQEATTAEVPVVADVTPADDETLEQLAAAYEAIREMEREGIIEAPSEPRASLRDALEAAPPAPEVQKHDNLMLYLEPDEES